MYSVIYSNLPNSIIDNFVCVFSIVSLQTRAVTNNEGQRHRSTPLRARQPARLWAQVVFEGEAGSLAGESWAQTQSLRQPLARKRLPQATWKNEGWGNVSHKKWTSVSCVCSKESLAGCRKVVWSNMVSWLVCTYWLQSVCGWMAYCVFIFYLWLN